MFGVEMYKVHYFDSFIKQQILKIDQLFTRSYSIDIKPQIKYILDNKLQWSLKRNTMFFDIETWVNPDFQAANKPEYAQMPITSIQTYNTSDEQYYIIV